MACMYSADTKVHGPRSKAIVGLPSLPAAQPAQGLHEQAEQQRARGPGNCLLASLSG
jgi:hypothetical protein